MFPHSALLLCFLSLFYLPSNSKANPLTDCMYQLNSETLCYGTLGCQSMCNAKAGIDCKVYCDGLSTEKRNFVVDECVPIPSVGSSSKSLCKCKDMNGNGPTGITKAACNGVYLGQLIRGAIKATIWYDPKTGETTFRFRPSTSELIESSLEQVRFEVRQRYPDVNRLRHEGVT